MVLYESTSRPDLPALPNFTQLSDRVWRVMGLNPGKFTLQGTNTYLVGTGNRKVLIDCGDGQPDYVPLLIQSLKAIHPEAYISDIIVSHSHRDHWGGLHDIMASELNQKQLIQVHKYPLLVKNTLDSFPESILFTDLNDGQIITVDEQVHIRVVHTPGHTKDHCAFYLEEEDTMFTADCILGHGSVSFEDLTEYVGGLKRVQELKPTRLYPGHGDVVDNGMEKVEQYLSLRMAKEKQILDLLCQDTNRTWTPIELVEEMSSKKDHYTEQLIAVVVGTVGLHLIKLYHDGKAEIVDADTFKKTYQIDPYDANNVFSIVNQKWTYTGFINSSKL